MTKKIIISGATGFIGQAVIHSLLEAGYEVIGLSRNPQRYKTMLQERLKFITWDGKSSDGWWKLAEGSLAFINLAGENIGSGLWTRKKKERMIESRIDAGRAMTEAFMRLREKPKTILQASAIGYYGDGNNEELSELSGQGQGFLADLTQQWENSISAIDRDVVRVLFLRIGLVLGRNGGVLSKMSLPFRLYMGGHFGNGQQWMSWIHLQDVSGAIKFALETDTFEGTINLTSPVPSRARDFFKILGNVLQRPSWLHIPENVLQLLLGEMAREALLISQKVVPNQLQAKAYQFKFTELEEALRDILS